MIAPSIAAKANEPTATCSREPPLLESETALAALAEAALLDFDAVPVDVVRVEEAREEVEVLDADAEAEALDEGYVDPDALISKESEVA